MRLHAVQLGEGARELAQLEGAEQDCCATLAERIVIGMKVADRRQMVSVITAVQWIGE